jgi:ABC-type glutathione transport system ATPase component
MEALLEVQNLTVHHRGQDGKEQATLVDLSFVLREGETLGLLGQSGCGKTTLALALLSLLPGSARVVRGSIHFREHDMLSASERKLQQIRGAQAAIIFQEPATALNPVLNVGEQIREVARAHLIGRRLDRSAAEAALAEVGLGDRRILSAYPHQLSAGQRQRVVIAQALVCRPSLLIADEPCSALDNVTTSEILNLLKQLKRQLGLTLLFITHNPSLLLSLADRLLIMQAGRFVEDGSLKDIYQQPKHLYTQELLRSIPPLPEATR